MRRCPSAMLLKLKSDIDHVFQWQHAANCVPGPWISLLECLSSSTT
jgi:hypothetical protein